MGNAFRLTGDMLHLLSIVMMIFKITATKSVNGISLKTQELYLVVFVTRYLDLFTNYVSLYNTCMKIFFIGATFTVVYLMRTAYWKTYDISHDTFRVQFVLGPCLLLAMLINEEFSFM